MPKASQATSRRVFLIHAAATAPLLACGAAQAQAKRVDEADETAVGLGYKHDTTKVDSKKYPQHKNDQVCSNCSFWQGEPKDEWAGCSMFGRKHIANKGWCVAWRKV